MTGQPHNAKDILAAGNTDTEADPVRFDDPDAWGFCKYCAFDVAVTLNSPRLILEHDRTNTGWIKRACPGGNLEPTDPPGKEAFPAKPPPKEEAEDDE